METNSLPLDIYFLPLDQKLIVHPNLTRLAPNHHEFESSLSLKRDMAAPTLTFLSPPQFSPLNSLATSTWALAPILCLRTLSDHQWQPLISSLSVILRGWRRNSQTCCEFFSPRSGSATMAPRRQRRYSHTPYEWDCGVLFFLPARVWTPSLWLPMRTSWQLSDRACPSKP
jgi:hypothetical protein